MLLSYKSMQVSLIDQGLLQKKMFQNAGDPDVMTD